MKILDRYCIKEFARYFIIILISFVALYIVIDFFGRLRMFLSNQATLRQMGSFVLFSVPMIIWQIIPACVLISSLVTFGSLSRSNEIIAIKAGGVSIYRMALPVIVMAASIGIIHFALSEVVTPYTNERAEHIKLTEIQKREAPGSFKQNQIWYRGKAGIYNFKVFDGRTNTLHGITIYRVDRKLNLVQRDDAEKGQWENGRWVFYDLITTSFAPGEFPKLEASDFKAMDMPEEPENFMTVQKNAENMGFRELRKYIQEIQADGYDATSYLVDMHAKLAFPLINIIMAILGIASSISWERRGGIAQGLATGIMIGFSYWIFFAFLVSLGRAGALPPLLAAWTTNILFGGAAGYLFLRVRT